MFVFDKTKRKEFDYTGYGKLSGHFFFGGADLSKTQRGTYFNNLATML